MRNFDITSVALRTVNGGSLRNIAINNFEKSQTIKICVLPYGRQPLRIPTVYLDQRKQSR